MELAEDFLVECDRASPVSVDVVIRSRGVGVLTSLLLLSFKLRRRTGFLRIRLKEIGCPKSQANEIFVPKTGFPFTEMSSR